MDKQSRAPEGRKKAYSRPELQMYGNLAQITAAVGMTGNMDGGSGGNNKTQP